MQRKVDKKLIEPCFTVVSFFGLFSPTLLGLVSVLTGFPQAIIAIFQFLCFCSLRQLRGSIKPGRASLTVIFLIFPEVRIRKEAEIGLIKRPLYFLKKASRQLLETPLKFLSNELL